MVMASPFIAAAILLHRHLFRSYTQRPFLFHFFRPFCSTVPASISTSATKISIFSIHRRTANLSPFFSHCFFTSHASSPPEPLNQSHSSEEELEEEEQERVNTEIDVVDDDAYKEVIEGESENLEVEDSGDVVNDGFSKDGLERNEWKLANLTVKEKKGLASHAHRLGKKLKCVLVGKSGITENLVSSLIATLKAYELMKIKIHRTCPGELEDVVQQLEKATGCVMVGKIGRSVIVYWPSLTKMRTDEKRMPGRKIFVRKEPRPEPVSLLSDKPET